MSPIQTQPVQQGGRHRRDPQTGTLSRQLGEQHRRASQPEAGESQMGRDGLWLMLSAVITSGIGMLGWVLAANLLPRAAVGHASAFVAGFLLVAELGDLGLGAAVLRWAPRAGPARAKLLRRCYAAVAVASLLAAAVVLLLPTGRAIRLALPHSSHLAVPLFLAAGLGWALFQFQDNALVVLGRARWLPVENISVGTARVGTLLLAAPLLGVLGILLSWMIPAVAGVVVISALLRQAAHRKTEDSPGRLPTRGEIVSLLAPTYPAKVAESLLGNLVPLIVIARFGPAIGAVFFVVWMAGNAITDASESYAQALAVRIAGDPHHTRTLFTAACRRAALLFTPCLALAALLAGPALWIFGSDYASIGTTLLRLVIAACLPALFTRLVIAVFLGHGHGIPVGTLQTATAVGMITLVALVPAHHLWLLGTGFLALQLGLATTAAGWLITTKAWSPPQLDHTTTPPEPFTLDA